MAIKSIVIAEGRFLPGPPITNYDIAKFADTNDEWIRTRTGISSRHHATDEQLTSHMATNALKDACVRYNLNPGDIDGVIVATTTADKVFPSTAALVQSGMGGLAPGALCFDVNAACAGFVYAITIADSLIKNNVAKTIAVIGAERMSSLIRWDKRDTCVLFGDGAGIMVLQRQNSDRETGVLAHKLQNFGDLNNILYVNGGIASGNLATSHIHMRGAEVFRHAVEKMSAISTEVINMYGLTIQDIRWVIPHQANQRIMDAMSERLGIPADRIVSSISRHANTSAASIPLAYSEAVASGKIKSGDLVVLTGLGAGIAAGAVLIRI
jgi:3-oxoacyl-[acyl-carrier-protein] synthase-3